MKYWRGYLIAFIAAVISWAFMQFAQAHPALIDMLFPYVSRLVQGSLAEWSAAQDYCLWQAAILIYFAGVLTSIVLMAILRWNPIQVFGWILVPLSLVNTFSTVIYGMNEHTGSIAEDLRIETTDYSISALEQAAIYYADKAAPLSSRVSRDSAGRIDYADFAQLAQDAGEGFSALTYEHKFPIFAGSLIPVKELGWSDMYTEQGVTGMTVALTGESAVNPQVPDIGLPIAICHEMAHRMSIARDPDANMAAMLACMAHPDRDFQYAGYLMALRYCYNSLDAIGSAASHAALIRVQNKMNARMIDDIAVYEDFFPKDMNVVDDDTVSLLVSWHYSTVILPKLEAQEPVITFDPMDETDERLWDVLYPSQPIPEAEATTP